MATIRNLGKYCRELWHQVDNTAKKVDDSDRVLTPTPNTQPGRLSQHSYKEDGQNRNQCLTFDGENYIKGLNR